MSSAPEPAHDAATDLIARDRRCVIHPYAAPLSDAPLFAVARAHGVCLELSDGRTLIDGMSSWWAAIHGYGQPALIVAAQSQLERMSHVMFGGLTHEPAIALCEKLVALVPGNSLTRVFLADSGSVSVEVALKLALQYWKARGLPDKRRFVTARGGYHGDTLGAMAVCDPVNGMHSLFQGVLAEHVFAEVPGPRFAAPFDDASFSDLERVVGAHCQQLAALVLEPIVQGAGGMRFYHPEYLRRARALCDRHDVLLILDEIATGFGRSGTLFGCEHAGVVPDIMCLGKALTGGMLTLAATLCSEEIARAISQNEPGAFMHGPTFMGNPLACTIALASIELLLSSPWQARVRAIEAQLARELSPCAAMPHVADVRVLGAIGVIELCEPLSATAMARVQPAFVERGVWLRPFGRLIYTMPPYIIEAEQLRCITGAMVAVTRDVVPRG
jgi:adenosylmethionine-8-amino-7-oxononanoate aminotransferase